MRVVCPTCKGVFAIEASALVPPPGKVAYIICPACSSKRECHHFIEEQEFERRETEKKAAQEQRRRWDEERKSNDARRAEENRLAAHAAFVAEEARKKEELTSVEIEIAGITGAKQRVQYIEPAIGSFRMDLITVVACLASFGSCGAGGYLLSIRAQAPDSILESIAHGVGVYFIAKGLFFIANCESILSLAKGRRFGSKSDLSNERDGKLDNLERRAQELRMPR